jgi:hypothetical protein
MGCDGSTGLSSVLSSASSSLSATNRRELTPQPPPRAAPPRIAAEINARAFDTTGEGSDIEDSRVRCKVAGIFGANAGSGKGLGTRRPSC